MHPGMRYYCVPCYSIFGISLLMHNLICHALLHSSFILPLSEVMSVHSVEYKLRGAILVCRPNLALHSMFTCGAIILFCF
jgi:hypothetical protein